MKYQNKRTNKIAEFIQESEKYKTVLLMYEDGTDVTISTSTLKRWWKPLPEEGQSEEVPKDTTENDISEVAQELAYEDTAEEISMPVAEPKVEKPKKKKMQKASVIDPEIQGTMMELRSAILAFASDNEDEVFTSSANSNLQALKAGGHLYARFTTSKKLVTISIPEKVVAAVGVEPHKRIQHMFGCVYRFDSAEKKESMKLVKILLKCAREYRVTKNLETMKKKEEN